MNFTYSGLQVGKELKRTPVFGPYVYMSLLITLYIKIVLTQADSVHTQYPIDIFM